YQLIAHKIACGNVYAICLDERQNRLANRLTTLERVLNLSHRSCNPLPISGVQQFDSKSTHFIQMTDVLLGAVGSEWNRSTTSPAKLALAQYIRERVGMKSFVHGGSWFWKFNMHIWKPRTLGQKVS